jgi:predicted permease
MMPLGLQAEVEDGVQMLVGEAVTGNYFSLTGIRPAIGRLISAEDDIAPGAHPVVVLGHGYWERHYGRDPSVVGSEIRLAGRQYTIIGVAPEAYTGFFRGLVMDAYVPIMMFDELMGANWLEQRGLHILFAMARLLPGITMAQAEAVTTRIANDLREEYPSPWPPSNTFTLVPTADLILFPAVDRFLVPVPVAGMLMIVVGLVLLIASANLASFLLARAADRRKEIAVRLALGARRRTLVGQLLTETMLLSTLGGMVGVALAVVSLNAIVAADIPMPMNVPITFDLSLDTTVLTFSVLVSVGAGILFGLAPALQSTNPDLAPTLNDETAGGGRAKATSLRNLLVVGQVSASVVLLVGAGLFLRSLDAARNIDPGFGNAPTGILQIRAQADRYSAEEAQVYFNALEERIAQVPGVQSVGYTTLLLLTGSGTLRLEVDGVAPPSGADYHTVDQSAIDDDFLDAAGVELVAGRGFDATASA